MMWKSVMGVVLAASLAGCTGTATGIRRGFDSIDPNKNPRPVLSDPNSGVSASAARAVPPFIAANYAVLREAISTDGGEEEGDATLAEADSSNMRRYLGAGFALSDIYCDEYFRLTDEAQRRRHFARSTTNDVGTAMSAVLGLANAGQDVVTGIATGFGVLDSTFRNYDDAFVAGPDLAQVRTLVLAAQDDFRARTLASDSTLPGDYGTAQSVIMRYANICSYLGMRSLLNTTAAAAERALQLSRENPKNDSNGTVAQRQPTNATPIQLPPGATPALPANDN